MNGYVCVRVRMISCPFTPLICLFNTCDFLLSDFRQICVYIYKNIYILTKEEFTDQRRGLTILLVLVLVTVMDGGALVGIL